MTDILLFETYKLLDEIKERPEYLRMKELKKKIDVELSRLLEEFKRTKERFAKEENKYSNEYKSLSAKLSALKEELFNEPLVKEYKEKEKTMQAYLDMISKDLIKVARGEGND